MLHLALAYFATYIPYALLAKALSSGSLPGIAHPVGGLVLLPAAALGQLAAMPIFLAVSGWWRFAREQQLGRRRLLLPGRDTVRAALCMAVVIGTTTLNFTFLGASILLMLILMRAGVLILSPLVDAARGRAVHAHSLVALSFSLLAAGVTLADVRDYRLPLGAVLSLAGYLAGYAGRFHIMSRVAKTGIREVDRRYFVEEHAMAPVFQLVLCAAGAALGEPGLRAGFTSFLGSPGALYGLAIGVCYEALFIFGTLIYLDVRGYAWCVPANRVATLFSGMVASFALAAITGQPTPSPVQYVAVALILCAVAALSYPAIRDRIAGLAARREHFVLFVCGGNESRSAMAECIARSVMAAARAGHLLSMASAGVRVCAPGRPMSDGAHAVLREAGVVAHRHRSRALTVELCRRAEVIYCMTAEQRAAVLALAPEVAARTRCLADCDIPEPAGASLADYRRCAELIDQAVRRRFEDQFRCSLAAVV